MNDKKKKVYDNDNVVLEVTETVGVKDNAANIVGEKVETVITVEQALDALAGYSLPRLELVEQGVGECVICGLDTNSPMRCVCFECMKKHGGDIYRKAKEAAKKAKKTFTI